MTTLKKSACVRRKKDYLISLNAFKRMDSFSTFKQRKLQIKMAAVKVPLPTEATIEETNFICSDKGCLTYRTLKSTNYSRNFRFTYHDIS